MKRTQQGRLRESVHATYDALIGMASSGEALDAILGAAEKMTGLGFAYLSPDGDALSVASASPDFHETIRFYPLQELQRLFCVVATDEGNGLRGHLILQSANERENDALPPVRLALQVYFNVRNSKSKKMQKAAEDFLQKLPGVVTPEELEEIAGIMRVDFNGGLQVVTGFTGDSAEKAGDGRDEKFLARLDSRLRNFSRNYMSCVKKNRYIALVSPPPSSDLASLTKNLTEICTHVAMRHYNGAIPPHVHLALGGACADFSDVSRGSRESYTALRLMRAKDEKRFLISWDELGALKLISKLAGDPQALPFCKETLKSVAFSDFGENDELFETLVLLEKNNWNLREVARKMFYHHNTIKHRYAKIQEMIRENLSDPEIRFNVSLALRMMPCISLDDE